MANDARDNLKNLFKEMYYYELDRHEKIRSSLVMPITILTIIIGAMLYYVKSPPHLPLSFFSYIFVILFLILWFFISQAIYFLIRTIFGLEYGYISTSEEIKNYVEELKKFHAEQEKATQGTLEHIDTYLYREINDLLTNQYCEFAQVNTTNNDIKSAYRHKALRNIITVITISATIFVLFDLMPFLYHLIFQK